MEHDKQLAFLQNMTHMALRHAATTPNVVTPKGGMTHEKMLSFVTAMAKHGLQHFDEGGTTLAAPAAQGPANNVASGSLAGAVGNFLGTNNQFQASAVPIQQGTNVNQLNNAYTGAQNALAQQGNITGTLQANLNQGANSLGHLTDTLNNRIAGVGPDPAQAALNQNTGNNIAQAAAVAAGTRGAGANAGLVARNAAQQGAATQQQAVGQAATQQAQQQLAAEEQLQNLASSQIAQGTAASQTFNNATQNEQNILQGANTSANNAAVSQQSNINNVNGQISAGNQTSSGNIISGIGSALSNIPIIGSLFAEGGTVEPMPWKKMASGGIAATPTSAPQSYVGQWLNSSIDTQGPGQLAQANISTQGADPFGVNKKKESKPAPAAKPTEVAPSPNDLSASDFEALSGTSTDMAGDPGGVSILGGAPMVDEAIPMALAWKGGLMKDGGKVKPQNPSEKANVKGDSLSNDKVPAMLSQGEIVIPRHITMGPNAPARAAQFVAQQLAKRGKK